MSPPGRRADRWRRLSKTFWLLPAAMCVLGAVLAEVLILLDQRLGDLEFGPFRMLVTRVGAAGSGDLLGAIAGSMLTVASTTFSITIPALALASSTYGPRLVRNFTADRGNQFVLGVFLATFLYSLLVLRSIRVLDEGGEQTFVPHLAVNVAVLLAVSALGVLVYFIHHIADSIQVWSLAQQGRTDLLTVVERLYPQRLGANEGEDSDDAGARNGPDSAGVPVPSSNTGYVQGIDDEPLLALATKYDLVVELRVGPGGRTRAELHWRCCPRHKASTTPWWLRCARPCRSGGRARRSRTWSLLSCCWKRWRCGPCPPAPTTLTPP